MSSAELLWEIIARRHRAAHVAKHGTSPTEIARPIRGSKCNVQELSASFALHIELCTPAPVSSGAISDSVASLSHKLAVASRNVAYLTVLTRARARTHLTSTTSRRSTGGAGLLNGGHGKSGIGSGGDGDYRVS